jgi:V8-like Glu-specific endopeptidase
MCLFGAKGPLMKTENNLLHYKISTNHGQSGGPIFIKTI